jgi:hypothetical protein
MSCTTLGIDLAKPVFPLHGVDEHGRHPSRDSQRHRTTAQGQRDRVVILSPPCPRLYAAKNVRLTRFFSM